MSIDGEYIVSSAIKQLSIQIPNVTKRYREEQVQNVVRPCFFVTQISQGQEKRMRNNYKKNYRIRITYLGDKSSTTQQDLRTMGETLLEVFHRLVLKDNSFVYCRDASYEIIDGELLFTADVPIHSILEIEAPSKMQTLESRVDYID